MKTPLILALLLKFVALLVAALLCSVCIGKIDMSDYTEENEVID